MKKIIFAALLAVLVVLSFAAGHWYSKRGGEESHFLGRRVLYYVDPMNPSHTSDKPGIAPCGMKMEPVYADEGSPGQGPGSTFAPMPLGTVNISPEKQQLIGVRTAAVEKASVSHAIRTVGRVTPDEKRVYRLVAGTDGWIRETYDNDTGTLVKKDERLASFYSPQFRAAQLSYIALISAGGEDRFQAGGRQALAPSQQASVSLQTYIDALESLGMSEQQIKDLAQTRQLTDRVYIVAPATGFIIARNVSPRQQFEKGTEWYRIADLSHVWILADLFRNEAEYIKPGMKVRATLPQQKKEFQTVVSKVLPQFDPTSRTLKVRLELDNPGYVLRPDMFVDVEFPITLPPAIVAPSDAVLDSGLKKTVFVDRGNGFFEPRLVETGWRFGDRVEIIKGLMEGEQIVISGNFLIDSESRMKIAAAGMYGRAGQGIKDPVCGMEIDPRNSKGAGLFLEHDGKSYYFCMAECKQEFAKNPQRYVEKKNGDQGSRETGQRANHVKHTTVDKKRTLPENASAQGHMTEPPEKPAAKELMSMPESAGTPPSENAPQ